MASERKDGRERDRDVDEAERHGLLERIVKKGIEQGIGAISKSEDTVRAFVDGMKIPKEVANHLLDQVDETKKGLYAVVANEIRDFLRSTNFAGDVKKILTGLAFEVKMEVRFKGVENEDGESTVRPDVKADAALKPTRRPRRPVATEPPPAPTPGDDEEPE